MHRSDQINQFLTSSAFFYTIAIGLDSTYTYVSPNYDRNFGSDKGTLKGQHFSITLHPEDISICEQVGPKCFEEPDKLFPATLRKHDGQGGYVFTQWEMQAMISEEGSPEGIFCIGYNITEFVDTRARLYQAETQLDEISFIQSHGVRKPLANIIGLTTLIKQAANDEERELLTDMLSESAAELDQIISDISNKGS